MGEERTSERILTLITSSSHCFLCHCYKQSEKDFGVTSYLPDWPRCCIYFYRKNLECSFLSYNGHPIMIIHKDSFTDSSLFITLIIFLIVKHGEKGFVFSDLLTIFQTNTWQIGIFLECNIRSQRPLWIGIFPFPRWMWKFGWVVGDISTFTANQKSPDFRLVW